jgi:hypothetical protein
VSASTHASRLMTTGFAAAGDRAKIAT